MTAAMPSVLTLSLSADGDSWDHMAWGAGWWMMLVWGSLMMGGLVVLTVWLIRTGSARGAASGEQSLESARRILAERYARGELTTEEYRERADQLG